MALQVKHMVEVITPDEYDAAVASDPSLSPLAAAGDRRSGRRLLADAPTDELRTLARQAATAQGRAELDAIALAIEEQLAA